MFLRLKLLCGFLVVTSCLGAQSPPVATQGTIDLRATDLSKNRVALNGEWLYYPNQIIPQSTEAGYVQAFPHVWENGQGFASYSLKVITLRRQKELAISLPQIYSSYEMYANGILIASNGRVGKTESETEPQWLPQFVSFKPDSDTTELTITIANFHHYKGGIKDPIYIASYDLLYQHHRTSQVSNLTEAVTLFLLTIGFLFVYLTYEQKKIIVYFLLLCLSWSIRSVFSNQYLFIDYFPDFDWNTMIRIEYITLYMTMMWAILFLSRLFAKEGNQIIKYILVAGNCIFTAFTVITPPIIFTQWLNIYLIFAGILLVHGAVIVVRALINERVGAWYLTVSVLLAIGIFTYDISAFEGLFTYNPIVFSSGYILIFLAMSLALLYSLNILKSKAKNPAMMRYEDFFDKVD